MGYVIGSNMPGYLPEDGGEPYVVDTADEAREALIEELNRDADQMAHGESVAVVAEYDRAILALKGADVSLGYSDVVTDPEREHDLGRCYWIEIAEDEPESLPWKPNYLQGERTSDE